MIVHVTLPHFSLQVLAAEACADETPAACVDLSRTHPMVVDCTDAAIRDGVHEGQLLSRALGTSPLLAVIDHDEARIERARTSIIERLEDIGAGVEEVAPGQVRFDASGLDLLLGGMDGVARRLLKQFTRAHDVRVGFGSNCFAAEVAAASAEPHTCLALPPDRMQQVIAGMPIDVLPLTDRMAQLLGALGLRTCADLIAIGRMRMAERFGDEGILLWKLAQGIDDTRITPRVIEEPIMREIEFAEPVANLITLGKAAEVLIERACSDERLITRVPRTCTLTLELDESGSWQIKKTLREAMSDARRIALAVTGELAEVPAPATKMRITFETLAERMALQPELPPDARVAAAQERRDKALHRGLAHLQEAVGHDTILQVLELDPESGVPERRAALIPRGRVGNDIGSEAS